jgi:alkylated DNA repair dioxygenase AlkB
VHNSTASLLHPSILKKNMAQRVHHIGPGATVVVYPRAFAKVKGEALQKLAGRCAKEKERTFQMGGKTCTMHRKQLNCSTVHEYAFSGQTIPPCTETFELVEEAKADYVARFGGDPADLVVLVNRYGEGDYISPHSDDERALTKGSAVLTYIFGGAAGKFVFESKAATPATKVTFITGHGDVLAMTGPNFQERWTHAVPKLKGGKRGWAAMAEANPDMPWRLSVTIRQGEAVHKRKREERALDRRILDNRRCVRDYFRDDGWVENEW